MKTISQSRIKSAIFILLTLNFFLILIFAINWIELKIYGETPISLDEAIRTESRRYGFSNELIKAIVRVESSDGKFLNAFEPHIYKRLDDDQSDFERRALATSHGVMHVMGVNAQNCGLKWWELYDTKKGLTCGLKILSKCREKFKSLDQSSQMIKTLGCYNGDPVEYPKRVKLAYADLLLKSSH